MSHSQHLLSLAHTAKLPSSAHLEIMQNCYRNEATTLIASGMTALSKAPCK